MANISVSITANDNASKTVAGVQKTISSFSQKVTSIGSSIGSVFGGIQLSQIADKVEGFAKNTINNLEETGETVEQLRDVIGGTPTQVSALIDVFSRFGVTSQDVRVMNTTLSKQIESDSATWKTLGISALGANGKMKSFTQLLPQIADAFAKMKDPTQEAADASTLFGRSGSKLVPLLEQGGAGIKKFSDEAKAAGDTISGKTLDATYQYRMAQATLQESIDGVQKTIGAALYPTLTSLAETLSSKVVPAVSAMFTWIGKNRSIVMPLAAVLGSLIGVVLLLVAALKVWSVVQGILNVVMDANPIALIVLGIAALIAIVIVLIANWNKILPAIEGVWNDVVSFFKTVLVLIVNLFLNWTLLGVIITHMSQIKAGIQTVWGDILSFFEGIPGDIEGIFAGALGWLKDAGVNLIQGLLNGASSVLKNIGNFFLNLLPSWIVGPFKAALGIHSPSTVFAGHGVNIVQGLINGIASQKPALTKTMTGLVSMPASSGLRMPGITGGAGVAGASGGVYIGNLNTTQPVGQLMSELGRRGRWLT
jgi:hypothetical protein